MDNVTVIFIPVIIFGISLFLSMLGLGGAQLYVMIFYWSGMSLKTEAVPMTLLLNFITQKSVAIIYLRNRLLDIIAERISNVG